MRLSKKAEMGVGTLIIFIAMLLVAAVAAGVLIQTAGSLQEKALSTGQQAKGQIATNVRIVEVSATDGSNGSVLYFEEIVKLAPGSDPIKIGQAIFTFNTYDATATLKYRGVNNTYDNSGTGYVTYRARDVGPFGLTPVALVDDLDDDGNVDYIRTLPSGEDIQVNISGDGTPVLITVATGTNISNASGINVAMSLAATALTSSGTTYGTIALSGTTATNDTVDAGISTLTPENAGQGYFAVEYLQEGSNFVEGNLQRGDVAKIYYEAPREVGEDEEVRINFIPKIGTATLTQFVSPEVISTERVYLYP